MVIVITLGVLLRGNASDACTRIYPKGAGRRGRDPARSAITNKVAPSEQFDKVMFGVARDGAGVADACRCVNLGSRGRRRTTCEACKNILSERAKNVGAFIEFLSTVRLRQNEVDVRPYIRKDFSRIGFKC